MCIVSSSWISSESFSLVTVSFYSSCLFLINACRFVCDGSQPVTGRMVCLNGIEIGLNHHLPQYLCVVLQAA